MAAARSGGSAACTSSKRNADIRPATGSASGPLGCYLVRHKVVAEHHAGTILNLQGVKMKRPSYIHVSVGVDHGEMRGVRRLPARAGARHVRALASLDGHRQLALAGREVGMGDVVGQVAADLRRDVALAGMDGAVDAALSRAGVLRVRYLEELFDAAEIDELLTLRILTLSEEEKWEMGRGDSHARAILERSETLPVDQLLKLHGAVRGLRAVKDD